MTSAGAANSVNCGCSSGSGDGLLDHLHPVGPDRARTGRLLPRPARASCRVRRHRTGDPPAARRASGSRTHLTDADGRDGCESAQRDSPRTRQRYRELMAFRARITLAVIFIAAQAVLSYFTAGVAKLISPIWPAAARCRRFSAPTDTALPRCPARTGGSLLSCCLLEVVLSDGSLSDAPTTPAPYCAVLRLPPGLRHQHLSVNPHFKPHSQRQVLCRGPDTLMERCRQFAPSPHSLLGTAARTGSCAPIRHQSACQLAP